MADSKSVLDDASSGAASVWSSAVDWAWSAGGNSVAIDALVDEARIGGSSAVESVISARGNLLSVLADGWDASVVHSARVSVVTVDLSGDASSV